MKVNFEADAKRIKEIFDSDDLLCCEVETNDLRINLFYLDSLSDKLLMMQEVVSPLRRAEKLRPEVNSIKGNINYSENIEENQTLEEAAEAIAGGDILILADGAESYFVVSLKNLPKRAVQEPPTETVIRGPREGFIEEVKTNVALLRKRLKTPDLRVKQFSVGKYSNTVVFIMYLNGVADNDVVKKVTEKIEAIDLDGAIDSSYVSFCLEENHYTIFNQIGKSEKPDIVAAKILEGRVAILSDGSPSVLTVPYVMFESFQDSYDYYDRDYRTTMLRIVRMLGAFLTVMLPGIYVSLQEYHYHLMPLKFLITVLNAKTGIPFSAPMEMMFVLLLFEVLHQASVRMPRYVGTALSIVGAIVLGQTAVNAGLLSSPAVLVIAISAIGINCLPDLVGALSILRFVFLLMGSLLGIYGILVLNVVIIAYLASMKSYGSPYLAPFAPIIRKDMKDTFFKAPLKGMQERPFTIPTKNRRRMKWHDQ